MVVMVKIKTTMIMMIMLMQTKICRTVQHGWLQGGNWGREAAHSWPAHGYAPSNQDMYLYLYLCVMWRFYPIPRYLAKGKAKAKAKQNMIIWHLNKQIIKRLNYAQKNNPVQLAEKRRVPTDKKTTQIRWQSGGAKYTIKLFKKQIQILKLFLPHSPGPLHPIFKLNLWILNNASHCQLASTPTFSLRNEILGFPYITWV